MSQLLIFTISIILTSCSFGGKDTKRAFVKEKKESVIVKLEIINSQKDCEVIRNIDLHIDDIIDDPNAYVNDKISDNCVLALIDSINMRAIRTDKDEFLKALEAICNVSDGYVSEYFLDIGVYQFYHNFNQLINYAFLQKQENSNCLRQVIIEAISMEFSDGGEKKEKEVAEFIKRKIKEYKYSQEKIIFIQEMQEEFDSSMFD